MSRIQTLIIISIALLSSTACQKEIKFTDNSNAKLDFSTDTVHFDTVFTTIGSTTQQFRIYNRNSNAIKTTVKLAGGSNSNYRLNIDGRPSNQFNDLEIRGNDSAYIFVEVNVDPQNSNSPLIIRDSILFSTNGNLQDVKLVSYGQDVHLFKDSVIQTQTWINDKPYLIYNNILLDSAETLTIEPGVQIHFHNSSSLLVKGTLNVQGEVDNMVVFQGDRLDYEQDYPGQWGSSSDFEDSEGNNVILGGIHFFQSSISNIINYAEIKNGIIGIQVYPPWENNPVTGVHNVTIANSIIRNMSLLGIDIYSNSMVLINTVVANCGYHCVRLMHGGSYGFYHSTIANYMPGNFGGREASALAITNYFVSDETATIMPLHATFGNTIIHGNNNSSVEDDLVIDQQTAEGMIFELLFDHCMIRLGDEYNTSDTSIYNNIIRHKDSLPRFVDYELGNFRLDTLSAAINYGSTEYAKLFPTDLDGNDRTNDLGPDIGAYERQLSDGILEE